MEKVISLMGLLKEIEIYRARVFKNISDIKEDKLQSFTTLVYKSTGKTIKGVDKEVYEARVKKMYEDMKTNLTSLAKLLKIKEEVNSSIFLDVEIPIGDEVIPMKLSITSILSLKSNSILDYMRTIECKLSQDNALTATALEQYVETVMAHDRVDTYVRAKFASLNLNSRDLDTATYNNFANEYREANSVVVLDPLETDKAADKVEMYDGSIAKLYNEVSEANVRTKIRIDLDEPYDSENLWNYA